MPHRSRWISRALAGGVLVALGATACTSSTPEAPSTSAGASTAGTSATSPTSTPVETSTASPPSTATSTSASAATTATATSTTTPPTSTTTRATPAPSQPTGPVTLLGGLDIAWSVALLPDGSALVSERNTGRVHHVPKPGTGGDATVVGRLPIFRTEGEGGLLGLAVAADFDADPVVYAYYTTNSDNRIAALPWRDGRLGEPKVIFSGIPSGRRHDGGRIAFGPDGYLYVGTGEAGDTGLSQNLDSLGGKILRITKDGDPAPGNPFGGSPVWSYGHRNVQGLAWDSRKHLWASEFGQNTWDELNLIEAGKNYGWPEVEGRQGNPDFVDPVAQWATDDMSPSGIAVGPDGAVYLAALRGESVWRVPVDADGTAGKATRHLNRAYGRIRDIRFVGNRVWITTSNNDHADRLLSLPLSAVGVG
ncbi:MAG: PQQ-dependent sugar dehydrogenase [Terrabacter sp.]